MVQDSRTKTRARSIKPLNAPVPVPVRADAQRRPVSLCLDGSGRRWIAVVEITDMWKINDEWWRGSEQEIERVYYDVQLENGQRLTVFHDLIVDNWRRQAG